jgi:tyrosyl-tRNA synthetase
MNLSEELEWRGLIKDHTFENVEWLDSPNAPKKFYLGSDGSSNSLTVGNLAIYMLARRLVKHGWEAVLLFGGATTRIGDPGGKDQERDLKSVEEVENNVKAIKDQASRLFSGFDDKFTVVNNYDWFKDWNFIDFLRDVGKHYSMTELTQRDYIFTRMGEGGSGISYAEFSYNLIQGYDFYHLFKEKGVILQIGGSDQWGNMLSGVPLIRKKAGAEAHALSMPLVINKSTGKKFGKSEEGAIWLDEEKTSVYKFYQFWLNADDEGVEDYLKIFTELDKPDIESLMAEFNQNRASRIAQKTLALEMTKLVHGQERANSMLRITDALFGGHNIAELTNEDYELLLKELPLVEISDGEEIASVLVKGGLASSNSEARRFLSEGAIYVDGVRRDTGALSGSIVLTNSVRYGLIRRGKNSYMIVKVR